MSRFPEASITGKGSGKRGATECCGVLRVYIDNTEDLHNFVEHIRQETNALTPENIKNLVKSDKWALIKEQTTKSVENFCEI